MQTHPNRLIPEEVQRDPSLKDLPVSIWTIGRYPFLLLIKGYQRTISRMLPPDTCRFHPSCSHYGYQAIYKHGALAGSILAFWRVLRCNPFNPGGYDPIPEQNPFIQIFTPRKGQTPPVDTPAPEGETKDFHTT